MRRALSISDIYKKSTKTIYVDRFVDFFGEVDLNGSWIIWGNSSSGKTSFALQLIKELSKYRRAVYNSLEQGLSVSMQAAVKRENLIEVRREVTLLNRESIDDLVIRLNKQKSPGIIVIDSVQYTGLNYQAYKALVKQFPHKLFIWISHAEGKNPSGQTAQRIRYDADIKISVEGFIATANSRFGGGKPYIISQEKAIEYYGYLPNQDINDEY